MQSTRHIVLITPGFPLDEADSTCIPPLQLFAKSLNEIPNYRVSVIALQYPHVSDHYRWNGIDIYPAFSGHTTINNPLKWLKAKRLLKTLHRNIGIDVIHAFWMTEAALVGQYMSKSLNVPFLITQMGQDILQSNKYLRILNLKRASALVAVSHFQKSEFEKHHTEKVDAVIPWGLDASEFPPKQTQERSIHLLGVGSLIPLKNYSDFLIAVEKLKEEIPGFKAVLIGDGVERQTLQTIIEQHQLQDAVKMVGALPRQEVLALMCRSKVLYHPSSYESQGYVIYEALYSGMAVVCRQVGVATSSLHGVYVSDAFSEQLEDIKTALQAKESETSTMVPQMNDTVNAYCTWYDKLFVNA